jgi:hypothetical protein
MYVCFNIDHTRLFMFWSYGRGGRRGTCQNSWFRPIIVLYCSTVLTAHAHVSGLLLLSARHLDVFFAIFWWVFVPFSNAVYAPTCTDVCWHFILRSNDFYCSSDDTSWYIGNCSGETGNLTMTTVSRCNNMYEYVTVYNVMCSVMLQIIITLSQNILNYSLQYTVL